MRRAGFRLVQSEILRTLIELSSLALVRAALLSIK